MPQGFMEYICAAQAYLGLPWDVCALLGSLCSSHWHLEKVTQSVGSGRLSPPQAPPPGYCLEAKKRMASHCHPEVGIGLSSWTHEAISPTHPLLSLNTAWPSLSSELSPRDRAQILPHRFCGVTLGKKFDLSEPPCGLGRINPM